MRGFMAKIHFPNFSNLIFLDCLCLWSFGNNLVCIGLSLPEALREYGGPSHFIDHFSISQHSKQSSALKLRAVRASLSSLGAVDMLSLPQVETTFPTCAALSSQCWLGTPDTTRMATCFRFCCILPVVPPHLVSRPVVEVWDVEPFSFPGF